jgi:hypothetical protein
MLYKLHAHGTYIDDILFGVIFVVKLAIFLFFTSRIRESLNWKNIQKQSLPNPREIL